MGEESVAGGLGQTCFPIAQFHFKGTARRLDRFDELVESARATLFGRPGNREEVRDAKSIHWNLASEGDLRFKASTMEGCGSFTIGAREGDRETVLGGRDSFAAR